MGVFRQLGDPLAVAVCLCQHHAEAYVEYQTSLDPLAVQVGGVNFAAGATIVQVPITIIERCCVVVNAATVTPTTSNAAHFEIERPNGTIRTQQRDVVLLDHLYLHHHAAWEVLDPGTYTYELINRSIMAIRIAGAWIKAIASDCEG